MSGEWLEQQERTEEELSELRAKARANAERIRAEADANDKASVADTMAEFQALASKATGLSVEELLAIPVDPSSLLQPKPPATRAEMVGRGIPEIHLRAVFDRNPDSCQSLEAVNRFLSGPQTILVLSGGIGTRKSGSAAWGLCQRSGRWVSADDLGRVAAQRDEESISLYRSIKSVGLLVIDDLGGEYLDDKGWFTRALNSIVNTRYEACAKTLITTNLDATTFKAGYGDRLADRIRECGWFERIAGESVRRRPA